MAGSLRGDSHSSWKSVSLGLGDGEEEGVDFQPESPFCHPSMLTWFSFPCSLLSLQGAYLAVGTVGIPAGIPLPLRN